MTPRRRRPDDPSRRWLVWASAVVAVVSLAVAAFAIWNRPAAVQKTRGPPDDSAATRPGAHLVSSHHARRPDRGLRHAAGDRRGAALPARSECVRASRGGWFERRAATVLFAGWQMGGVLRAGAAAEGRGQRWSSDPAGRSAQSHRRDVERRQHDHLRGVARLRALADSCRRRDARISDQARWRGTGIRARVSASPSGRTTASCSRSGDNGKEARCCRWTRAAGMWCCPRPAFASGMFEATAGSAGRILLVDQTAGLMAAPFDPARPAPTSVDASVLTDVYYDVENESRGWLAVSTTGTAVYATGNPSRTSLVWVDRDGKIEPLAKDQDVVSGSQHVAGRAEGRGQARARSVDA